MKNLFTLPIEPKENDVLFFKRYEVKTISKETMKEIEEMNMRITSFQKQYKKTYSKIYSVTSMLFMLCLFIGIISMFSEDKTKGLVIFGLAIVFLITTIILMRLEIKSNKEIQESEEYTLLGVEGERLIQKAYDELGLVKDNNEVDIYLSYYREKDGKFMTALPYSAFMSKEYLISKDDKNLILGDIYGVLNIPLNRIEGIEKIEHAFTFYGWNKKELPNSEEYKNYNIKNINNTMYFKSKDYYALKINASGMEVAIFIAPYDVEKVKRLIENQD